jgi:hypothetical protein
VFAALQFAAAVPFRLAEPLEYVQVIDSLWLSVITTVMVPVGPWAPVHPVPTPTVKFQVALSGWAVPPGVKDPQGFVFVHL